MKNFKILFVISLVFLAQCKGGAIGSQDEIRIGEFGSLTGSTATFGRSTHQGILLAVDEVNAAGGLLEKKIKLLTEDDRSLPEEAKTAVLKLIKQQNVVALIGEVASSRTLAAAPEAQHNHIPLISPASTNPQVTAVGDYIFRACFIDSFQGSSMAQFARNNLSLSKVALLKDIKNDYSIGLADFFQKKFTELGGDIVASESYSENDIEFRSQLTNLLSKNPEALFIPGYYTEVGLIARQARELGFKGVLLGGDGWDSEKTVEIGGEALNNSYYTNHYSPDDPNPVIQSFIKKFQSKYGKIPDAMSVLGYDAANILFAAIQKSGTIDGDKVKNALSQTKNFSGVSGTISMDVNRNAEKKVVVLKIENQKVSFAGSVEVSNSH